MFSSFTSKQPWGHLAKRILVASGDLPDPKQGVGKLKRATQLEENLWERFQASGEQPEADSTHLKPAGDPEVGADLPSQAGWAPLPVRRWVLRGEDGPHAPSEQTTHRSRSLFQVENVNLGQTLHSIQTFFFFNAKTCHLGTGS